MQTKVSKIIKSPIDAMRIQRVTCTFSLPVKLKKELDHRAVDEGVEKSDIATKAIRLYLNQSIKQEQKNG